MKLVWPAAEYLPSYIDALERGWSPNTVRPESAQEELERIRENAQLFIEQQVDRDALGPRVTLPDGSTVSRIPGYRRWMWDGDFCGVIGLRWQPGTNELPPHVLGHVDSQSFRGNGERATLLARSLCCFRTCISRG